MAQPGRYRQKTYNPDKFCEFCKSPFFAKTCYVRFCGRSCSAKWRSLHLPKSTKHMAKMQEARKYGPRPDASARMKKLNSDPVFRDKLDAMSKSRKGQSWLGKKGGNGFLTTPQILLSLAIGWPVEVAIETAPVKGCFESLPTCYKVDLGLPAMKIAVEVDGSSHRTKKWRFLDARKTEVLEALGWRVLRFTNEEVLTNLGSITSKLRAITTTSQTAFSSEIAIT